MASMLRDQAVPDATRSTCPGKKHGTAGAYTWHGCRCPDARSDYARSRRERRRAQGMRPAVPTLPAGRYAHMLRELLDGRTYRDVADRLGWAPGTLSRLLNARRVQGDTADRITQLHRLLVKPLAGPATARRGRPPRDLAERPADPALVEMAVGGEVPWEVLGVQDRQAVVAELMGLGLSIRDSAARLRVTDRTVCRWRARGASSQSS